MKLVINNKEYICAGMDIDSGTIRYELDVAPEAVGDIVQLLSDNNEVLREDAVADYLRYYMDGTTLVLTNTPEPEPEPVPEPVVPDVNVVKSLRIAESKTVLAKYLAAHPLTWTDGKQYSVTEDKQALLTGNIAAYQLAVTLGKTAELTWNATGEECTVWTFEALAALAIAIKAYVKPLVAYQQAAEVAINACTTVEAVAAVPLDYGSVGNA